MKIQTKKIKISEIIHEFKNDMYTITEFQRKPDAWSNKNKELLIKSILQNFYIPPLLFSNKKILDGLQRINCLNEFINDNKFKVSIDNLRDSKYFWSQLKPEVKKQISNYELIVVNVMNEDNTELSDEEQKELFIRINENSIKLNAAEKFFSKCNHKIREIICEICKNSDLHLVAQNKKGKRFSIEMIMVWCLTIIHYRSNWSLKPNTKKSIRNLMDNFGNEEFDESETNEIIKRSNKAINMIYQILGDTIVPGKFKVIFTSIFVPFYENIESCNSFLTRRLELKEKLSELYKEFVENQQIGGIHYDSYRFINESIKKVEECLDSYKVDDKRIFTQKEKQEIYLKNLKENKGEIRCSRCGKLLNADEIEYDHINSFTLGGKTNFENGQILCKECNKKLGSKIKTSKKIIDLVQKVDDICDFDKLRKNFVSDNPDRKFSKIYWINELKILNYQEISFLKNLFNQRNMLCYPNTDNRYFPFGRNKDELDEEQLEYYYEILEKLEKKIKK